MLFAELALIRWVSAYQIYVAYFTNFILLGELPGHRCGIPARGEGPRPGSVGARGARARGGDVFVFRVVKGFDGPRDLDTLFGLPAPPIWVALPVLFGVAAFAMATIAEGVARLFVRFEPLEAYRLDITGSLGGIVAFSVLSFLGAGPVVWGLVLAGLFVALTPRSPGPVRWLAVGAIVVVFAAGSFSSGDTWSPYYRVTVYPTEAGGRIRDPGELAAAPVDAAARDDLRGVLRRAVHASGR